MKHPILGGQYLVSATITAVPMDVQHDAIFCRLIQERAALLSFFTEDEMDLFVKVTDSRAETGHWLFHAASLTGFPGSITVTKPEAGTKRYTFNMNQPVVVGTLDFLAS
ncbi:MAG: hypothetical protein OXI49_18160 [Acidobacteriota bacterium]|nr:hypothetical protein [Acidobacteriota bacterium]